MNSFKKMLQKSNDDRVALKHSKTMPHGSSSQGRMREPPRADPSKPAYRGKTPLKKSDIIYVEQAPGVLEINHGKRSQHTYHGLTHANSDARADLLDKFPHSHEPTEGLPRSGFRAVSLNSKSLRPQMSTYDSDTSGQQASTLVPSIPRSLHPILSRSAHSSRINIKEVPTHVAVPTPAPTYPQSFWPYSKYDEMLHEQDPNVLRGMINLHPLAPVRNERCPEHMRPMHFDMDDPRCLEKTLRWYIQMALAQGRPLDACAGGRYRRIVDPNHPMGIVPETGADWSNQGGYW
ncbi:hypothetical protein EDD22DRAFT_520731 [Suillus occidentalis]|nr:hypothetical protein EDD22DRAFT_520731 [Suillus occidentalis]